MLAQLNSTTAEPAFDLALLGRYFCELSPLPMLAVEGPHFVVRHMNDAFARLAGADRAELIGRPLAEAVPESPENGCLALLDRVYRTGHAENLREQRHGEMTPAFWSYAVWPILGDDALPVGAMMQVTDATEAADFRKRVTAMNETLLVSSVRQHELTELAETLNAALAGEHCRKDQFLAMLAHELRNPLAAISNSAELLEREHRETPLQHDARALIQRQVGQLIRLVEDLLDVSRINSGRISLRAERIEAGIVVGQAVETARALIERRRHTLCLSLPPAPLWLWADAARLEQIVVNLLVNAAKYTPEGGRVWLTVECLDGDVAIRVRDTGVGIAPDLLPKIFEFFTQGPSTVDRSHGGLGIGLALVQRLVELHGGRVSVQSELGHGSEFIVRLPVTEPASGCGCG